MKRVPLSKLISMFVSMILLFLPSWTNAFGVKYVDPKYKATAFLTISFPTSAIAFDPSGNLYIENSTDNGSGSVKILKLDAANNYTTSSIYISYSTTAHGVNGLAFNGFGSLFVSESNADKNSGLIREIDTAALTVSKTIPLDSFRPTGIATDASGNIFFPGRLSSDPDFGNIYKIDSMGVVHILLAGVIGTGIGINNSGNIVVSTPGRDVSPLVSQSIYEYDSNTLKPSLIATFDDDPVEELTFDAEGDLYVIDHKMANRSQTIIRLSQFSTISTLPGIKLLLLSE